MLEGRKWSRVKSAESKAIEQLLEIAPLPLPESYLLLLNFSNGGEGPLPVQPLWLCLYSAEEVVRIEKSDTFRDFFPNFFVIGTSGGGEAIAFDLREVMPYPIIAFDMTNIDLFESVRPIAASFDAVLKLIGREV